MSARGNNRLKIWLVILGVFALGCVTGAALDSAYRLKASSEPLSRDERRGKEDIFESMKRDLNLDERQATEVRAIIEQTRNEYRTLRAEVRPRYDAIRQNSRARIRALLTPEQQQRFDAKVAERDAMRDEREKNEH